MNNNNSNNNNVEKHIIIDAALPVPGQCGEKIFHGIKSIWMGWNARMLRHKK
jgi:hypothetical protein